MATTDESIPREPSAYRPSNHFAQRFREPERHLDGEIVATVIQTGEVTHRQADKFHLDADIDGVTFRLAVDPRSHDVITGHPLSVDDAVARASSRWSESDLEDIREFIAKHPDDR